MLKRLTADQIAWLHVFTIFCTLWLCLISFVAAFATANPVYKDRYALLGVSSGIALPTFLLLCFLTFKPDELDTH